MRVTTDDELDAALATLTQTDGPVLLELALDPDAMPRMHR